MDVDIKKSYLLWYYKTLKKGTPEEINEVKTHLSSKIEQDTLTMCEILAEKDVMSPEDLGLFYDVVSMYKKTENLDWTLWEKHIVQLKFLKRNFTMGVVTYDESANLYNYLKNFMESVEPYSITQMTEGGIYFSDSCSNYFMEINGFEVRLFLLDQEGQKMYQLDLWSSDDIFNLFHRVKEYFQKELQPVYYAHHRNEVLYFKVNNSGFTEEYSYHLDTDCLIFHPRMGDTVELGISEHPIHDMQEHYKSLDPIYTRIMKEQQDKIESLEEALKHHRLLKS